MTPIVFDLDGTLIDSAPEMHAAVARMLADEGVEELTLSQIVSFVGDGLPMLVERVIRATPLDMGRHRELTDRVLGYYEAGNSHLTRLYPRVRDCIETLAGQSVPMGICTNKPLAPTRSILAHFGLDRFFSAVIGGDSLPERKPDPAPLHAAFADLGTPGIFVGDSEVDAETAKAAGVPFALWSGGYRKGPPESLPHDFLFDDFTDLARWTAER